MESAGAAAEAWRHGARARDRHSATRRRRGHLSGRRRAGHRDALSRGPEGARARAVGSVNVLAELATAIARGSVRVVDLSQTLSSRFPQIVLPPEFDQCAPFRSSEISRYDERGPAWYWNNISFGEHTGTHFDAPIHWISGRDRANNSTDTLPVEHFIAPACVIDCSAEAGRDPDFLLSVGHL